MSPSQIILNSQTVTDLHDPGEILDLPGSTPTVPAATSVLTGPDEAPVSCPGALELPVLTPPGVPAAGGSISLDILLDAIGEDVKKTETKAGMAAIRANAQSREMASREKIDKIQEQIDKLEKAGIWDKICKAFSFIGAIAAVVVSAALVATGVGGAVGVAGLVLACTALANQIGDTIGEAVDGRGYGLTSLIARGLGQIFGEKAEGWIKMGLDVALMIASLACSFGASASKAADLSRLASTVTKVSQGVQGVSGVLQGGAGIATNVYQYQAAGASADQKRLAAILEQITLMNELVHEHLKKVIEENQNLTEGVSEIVRENSQTQTAILTETPMMS